MIVGVIGWMIGRMIVGVGGRRGMVVGVRGGGAHVAGRRCRTLWGRVTAAYFGMIATARGMVSGPVLRVRGERGDRQGRDHSNCKTISRAYERCFHAWRKGQDPHRLPTSL